MKNVFILLMLSCFICYGQGDSHEVQLVKNTFQNYKKAILAGNGTAAVEFLDKNTYDYYAVILDHAIHSDSADLESLSIIDKMSVYAARHRVSPADLISMTAETFLIYSIDNGMIGKNSVMALEMGEITVQGIAAKGQAVSNGTTTPLFFHYNKQGADWKIDLTSIFPPTNEALKKVIMDAGLSEDEFIFKALEMVSGKPVSTEIKKPLK